MGKKVNVIMITVLSLFTLFHFSIIVLHTGPLNPVYTKYRIPVENYISPLFTQNWNLFAPDPVEETQNILIQYRTASNETSEWFNISKPLLEANRSNIISAYNKAARIPSGLYFGIFKENDIITAMGENASDEQLNESIDMDKIEETRSKQIDLLYRFANSAIPLVTEDEVKDVRVRVVNVNAIPYSERNNPDYEQVSEHIDFDWKEYFPVLTYS